MSKSLFSNPFAGKRVGTGAVFMMIIFGALIAFEIFNYRSTQFALADILGPLPALVIPGFTVVSWATLLAVAFCAIDFAGIAKIFTPESGKDEPEWVYYLFGVWFLCAAFNATLSWWAVSVAVSTHSSVGSAIVGSATMLKVVPIAVASMILVVRVLLINLFAHYGDKMFSGARAPRPSYQPSHPAPAATTKSTYVPQHRPSLGTQRPTPAAASRPLYSEPTYHPVGMKPHSSSDNNQNKREYDA